MSSDAKGAESQRTKLCSCKDSISFTEATEEV